VAISINSLVSVVRRADFWIARAVRAAGHVSDWLASGKPINRAARMSRKKGSFDGIEDNSR
jgi:hypothetical protein